MLINVPGVYRLSADIDFVGTKGVEVACDNVLLDLNGKTVRYTGPSPETAVSFGIYAIGRTSVHVFNGAVTNCFFGAHFSYQSCCSVQGVDFSANRYIGVNAGGTGFVVRGCRFGAITGYANEHYAVGINNPGAGSLVEGCWFAELYRQPTAPVGVMGEGVGVLVSAGTPNVTVRRNWFENSDPASYAIGIWDATGTDGSVYCENTITDMTDPIRGHTATVTDNRLWLRSQVAGSIGINVREGVASGNVIMGFETALLPGNGEYPGITDGGGNVISP